jgi:hypothetical protein
MDGKATLHRYLRTKSDDLLGKLDGLSEYDARRPLTPTGTNLLGLVKHVASVELPLEASGEVPWWPQERRHVTLHQVMVHMCVERAHHLGHADILRELIDGAAGQRPGDPNLSQRSPQEWAAYRSRLEKAAREAAANELGL